MGSGSWEPVTRGTGTSDFFKETCAEWMQEGCTIIIDHDEVRPGKKRKLPTEAGPLPFTVAIQFRGRYI